jgi:hypothetical protein
MVSSALTLLLAGSAQLFTGALANLQAQYANQNPLGPSLDRERFKAACPNYVNYAATAQ